MKDDTRYGFFVTGLTADQATEISRTIISRIKQSKVQLLVYKIEQAKKGIFSAIDFRYGNENIHKRKEIIRIKGVNSLDEEYTNFFQKIIDKTLDKFNGNKKNI